MFYNSKAYPYAGAAAAFTPDDLLGEASPDVKTLSDDALAACISTFRRRRQTPAKKLIDPSKWTITEDDPRWSPIREEREAIEQSIKVRLTRDAEWIDNRRLKMLRTLDLLLAERDRRDAAAREV
jgi:hypothetical protein